ncbi:MAG: DUF1287 domain-containing protein [Parvibaculum sp.]
MLSRRNFLLSAAALPFAYPVTARACGCLLPPHAEFAPQVRHLLNAAENQIGETILYDPSYQRIGYPGGDVPRDRGVCCDVVIRAYRDGLRIDLQKQVHEDMAAHFSAYPRNWGLSATDRNIDHRRVPNLRTFLKRAGAELPHGAAVHPGDIVTQNVAGHLPHVVIVSADKNPRSGRYKVIHNIGAGTEFADTLMTYPMTGHYRYFGT